MSTAIKPGDTVLHKPSGETWIVAYADPSCIIACGWPETLVPIEECEMTTSCSQERHIEILKALAGPADAPKKKDFRSGPAFNALVDMGDIEYIRARRREIQGCLDGARRHVEKYVAELKRLDDIVNTPQPPARDGAE